MTIMILAAALMAAPQAAPAPAPPVAVAAIDPARLAAAEQAVAVLVPKGIYMKMMREQMPAMMQAMMGSVADMRPSDLGLPPDKKSGDATLGETMPGGGEAFAAQMAEFSKVMADEMGPLFDALEPRMRTGLARAFARRFTLAQLADINGFFATPSGTAFAGDYILLFMDPEVMKEMMAAMPEIMKAMPAIMGKLDGKTPAGMKPTQD